MAAGSSRLSNSCANRVKFRKLHTSRYNNNLGSCLDAFVGVFFSKADACVTLQAKPKAEPHAGEGSS